LHKGDILPNLLTVGRYTISILATEYSTIQIQKSSLILQPSLFRFIPCSEFNLSHNHLPTAYAAAMPKTKAAAAKNKTIDHTAKLQRNLRICFPFLFYEIWQAGRLFWEHNA